MVRGDIVSWQQAEDLMTAAFEYLGKLADADRTYLAAGSRSGWPQVIRSLRDGDYGDGQGFGAEATPSARLTRRQVALVDRVLLSADAAGMAVPAGRRRLVGRVIGMKRWDVDEFSWSAVWQAEGGQMLDLRSGVVQAVTSEAMRRGYERAIGRVAKRMTAMGMASEMGEVAA